MSKITLLRNLFSILFITFFALQLTAQTTYNTNGTYTVPAGVTAVSVEAWGGGGHGSNRSSNGLGGGGGGGAFSKKLVTVVPGSTYTVRVGNGSSDTNPGGDSWFINATTVLAKGGNSPADNSPTGAAGGSATASIGDIRFAGGNGANGNSDGGGGGSSAGPLANGNAATNYLGATAPAGGGNGGNGATGNNSNGVAGLSPGGGGGGAQRSNNGNRQGGNGANGQVIITPAGGMEIDVRGNNISIVNGDATPITGDNTDYGTTNVAGGNLTEGYTIHNTGTYALTLGAVTITGTNAADFTIVTVPATTVNPNSNTTLAIKFDPSAVGIRTATVTIPNNDNNESPYTFAIQGNANNADPNIFVIGNSIDIPDGNTTVSTADNTHFGPIDVALGTVSRTFTIQNRAPSAVALSIGAITITGANPGDFTVTTAPASTLFVNGTTTFTIQFNPSAAGVRTATINIANNNTTRNPYNFNVEGLGTGPEIAITGNNVIIVDGDTTPVMTDDTDFGFVSSTGGTIVKTFTIYNLSSANEVLTLGAITITGANAADFTITAMPALSIAVGASTTITISFDPSAIGQRNAVLSISNNDGDETPYNFAIRGTGSNAEIAVQGNAITINDGDITPSELDKTDFGTVSIDNGSVLITYTIRNTGTTPMSVGAITFSGPDTDCFSVATPPASTVAINGTTTFVVNFAPAATVGQKNVVISIVNDDANENPYDFALTGLAVRTYPDTDGDTISDNIDIDDDNDGILDIDEQSQCVDSPLATTAGHLFLNETFGAGTSRGRININIPGATSTYCYEDGIVGVNTPPLCVDQGDWSVNDGEYTVNHTISGPSGDPANISTWSSTNWTRQIDHTPGDVAGRMAIFNASYTPQVFYETVVSGIMPNVPLTYSFWALNIMSQSHYGGTILPNITVEFIDLENDAVVSTFNTGNIGRCGTTTGDNSCALSQWKNFTTTVNLGNVTSFIIRFINNATGGNGNDLALDDITIEQDYCDYEMDLISNLFDLDSDNDGIPDIEEAGFAHLSVGQGIMDLDETVWRDENRNGLHDEIDQLRSDGAYIIIDSDFDGVADYLDLDSDNDSLFDVDESGLFNGDGDVDGDGVGDGLDTDEDGFLDVFDAFTGRGTLVRPFAQITTGSGNPDYRNVDSDYDGIYDITPTLHNNFDIYGIGEIIGTDDIDRDGIYDNFDTTVAFMGSPRDLDRKLLLRFDGRNDYAAAPGMLGNLAQSSIMGWIKLSSTFDTTGYVVGQENFNIKIEASGNKVVATAKGISVTYPVDLAVDRWYHVAAVYDGGNPTEKLQLYVNGQMEVASNAGSLAGTLPASASPLTIGKYAAGNADYFKGDIDEVRVFNTALTTDQLQKMVYQEVGQNAAAVRGAIIPRDIEGSSWASMLACFRMDVYKDDVIDNLATTAIDAGASPTFARIYNVKHIDYQLAPMPFVTTLSAPIDVAVSQNNFVNGADVLTYDWSILHIRHDIDFQYNTTDLGLIIDPAVAVKLIDENALRNTWYLRLDGTVDLIGKAQLVQTGNSQLDPASTGSIERDQQGTTNKFNYNYWCSPVGAINNTVNNANYTVASVMKDGTDPNNIMDLSWTTSINSVATTPITLSSYWIFKFQNLGNDYANWTSVGPNGSLIPGEGYTLKGSSAASESQNFTFTGKPNNGAINIPISANNLNLTGNPYPSALDADTFITQNTASTTGTIYFWEHFSTNDTHVLQDYQGGYAARTLVGGTPPVSPEEVSGLGSSTRIPGRFIPVGQGFFVVGSATGGTVSISNEQRAFIKETNVDSNLMFKPTATQTVSETTPFNNYEDVYEEDTFARIRLGFNSPDGYHRQLLMGFMDQNATAGIDVGYDAIHIDIQPSDMYFTNGTTKLIISGEGYFNANSIYPVSVKAKITGNGEFLLDEVIHLDPEQDIYLHDATTGIYHDLRSGTVTIPLTAGTHDGRFTLRFTTASPKLDDLFLSQQLIAAYTSNNKMLNIHNKLEGVEVQNVELYNILGQNIANYSVVEQNQIFIQIPISNLATGTYIVKIQTSNGIVSEKIIIP